ncbi:MAG: hypothetical protein J7K75_10290 [Desulfuromonas sp.]|nr:hypothetical protein [Desulfuromonas sp.]
MESKELSAGSIIEARCSKCRDILNHTIIAMVDDTPALVMCNTCQGRHKYRVPKVKKTPTAKTATTATPKPRKSRKSPQELECEQWQELSVALKRAEAKPYGIDSSFSVNNVILHPVFGLGKVQRKVATNKIEVLFEQGMKLLRCA